jgi:hypothetical protein
MTYGTEWNVGKPLVIIRTLQMTTTNSGFASIGINQANACNLIAASQCRYLAVNRPNSTRLLVLCDQAFNSLLPFYC